MSRRAALARERGRALAALAASLPSRAELLVRAAELGYSVRFVDFCEDSETPGLVLGGIAGVCSAQRREIKIATRRRGPVAIRAALLHELDHAEGAAEGRAFPAIGLRCGARLAP